MRRVVSEEAERPICGPSFPSVTGRECEHAVQAEPQGSGQRKDH